MAARPYIVLVDDDHVWLATLAEFLREKGFCVRTASDGATGLALLERGEVALALVDGHLRDMEGLELLRRLRRRQRLPPVWVLSSDDDPSLAAQARVEGARGFLSKTLAPGLLLRTISQLVTGIREAAAAPPKGPAWRPWLPVLRRSGHYLPVPFSPRKRCPS